MSEDPTRAIPRRVDPETPAHGLVGPADPHADPVTEPALRHADLKAAPAAPAGFDDEPTVQIPGGPPDLQRPDPVVTRSRTGGLWTGLILSAVVGVLLLVFILQNLTLYKINFVFFSVRLPVGVAMLFAAIGGLLLVAIPGGLRILQLRRAARRSARRD